MKSSTMNCDIIRSHDGSSVLKILLHSPYFTSHKKLDKKRYGNLAIPDFLLIFANDSVSPHGLVGQDIDGNETVKPFVRLVSERRLRTLLFCAVKLRNFEIGHRGNATKRLRG